MRNRLHGLLGSLGVILAGAVALSVGFAAGWQITGHYFGHYFVNDFTFVPLFYLLVVVGAISGGFLGLTVAAALFLCGVAIRQRTGTRTPSARRIHREALDVLEVGCSPDPADHAGLQKDLRSRRL